MIARCDECNRIGAFACERLDPRTFKPQRRRLCTPCARSLRFVRVSFLRVDAMSSLGMRWHTR